jgi:hypothetical protein
MVEIDPVRFFLPALWHSTGGYRCAWDLGAIDRQEVVSLVMDSYRFQSQSRGRPRNRLDR